jgi:hypothetical protein
MRDALCRFAGAGPSAGEDDPPPQPARIAEAAQTLNACFGKLNVLMA